MIKLGLVRHSHACRRMADTWRGVPALAMCAAVAAAATACSSATPAAQVSRVSTGPASGAASTLGAGSLPAQTKASLPAFPAFYDAHRDMVVVTDAFPKAGAVTFHANYAPSLSVVKAGTQPAWYIIRGRAAAGQLAVLGSEPGETDYSPLWRTVTVTWKSGVKPTVLTSDNMILSLEKKGELAVTFTSMLVNATVISMP
jgi:hypothetical protein